MRYGPRETAADYFHSDFEPVFLDEMSSEKKQTAEYVCGSSNHACLYDFIASGNETFAISTRDTHQVALKDNSDVSK
jgi:hypothetical protein